MMPDAIESRLLYRDGLMIVLNKPAGMAVHCGPQRGARLEPGFEALGFGHPHPPALPHRLDRETSGCPTSLIDFVGELARPWADSLALTGNPKGLR